MNLKINSFLLLIASTFALHCEEYQKGSNLISCGVSNGRNNIISIEQQKMKEYQIVNDQYAIQNNDCQTGSETCICTNDKCITDSNNGSINEENKVSGNIAEDDKPKIDEVKKQDLLKKIPEFKKIKEQRLLMLSPSSQCQCHQKTVFFKYPSFIKQDIQNFDISELIIKEKEYFVSDLQYFNKNIKIKSSYKCLADALKNNNLIRVCSENDPNLYWKNNNEHTEINFNPHQRYDNILKHYHITRKDLLYKNYKEMKKNFPDDFNYLPETYTKEDMELFKKTHQNYKPSEDDLWIVKPKGLSRGRNIYILKDINDIKKNDIVTKYISNPLLIDKRKFDIRLYLLVTGHDPLKAYLFHRGLVRLATDDFDLNLDDLDNLYKHLTNTSINKNNKKGYKYDDLVLSFEEAKNYIEEHYDVKFSTIFEQIKDICIKTLISMNHVELEREKDFKLKSNNLFKIYGVDILIDNNYKPWLIEVNHNPDFSLFKSENHAKETKYQLVHDILNIIGITPYSHINGQALEGECTYKNPIEEAVDQSICEFTRPLGGFERIFPLKNNIEYYKKFFKNISPNNQATWDKITGNQVLENYEEKTTKLEKEQVREINEEETIKLNEEIIEERYPEFKKVESQKLHLVSPSPQCKINQRTVFFKYPKFMNSNMNSRVEDVIIDDNEYYVGALQQFNKNITSKQCPRSFKRTLLNNGIIRLFKEDNVNLYWRGTRGNSVIPQDINKYQKYNHMLMFHEITRKHLLYKNYSLFKKQFSKHFNYMPETYTQDTFKEFKEKFKDYKISKDNLWLIKPRNSLLGKGIRFLKNINDVRNNDIVTKYISDPLLINGRKFDLRFHVLVTGHNPLKIYMHTNGWAKVSSEEYDLDLDNLDCLYKHVTNIGLNEKNKGKYKPEEFILSFNKVKDHLRKNYNLNFSEVVEEVKDIVIKSLITMNHLEVDKEKGYKLHSNNLFDLYGLDVILDSKFKPWLVEINISPSLYEEWYTKDRKKMLRQTVSDTLNIVGMVPFSHIDGTPLDGDVHFENSVEEAVQQSICEFTRPLGGFERIFPLKNNIDYYKQFFKEISPNNQALWDEIQNEKH